MQNIYEVLASLLDRGAPLTVIEIGAHDGSDSYKLRGLLPNCRLFSFEPDPRNVAAIRARGFDRFTTLIESAVGDRDGTAEFHLSQADMAHPSRPQWLRDENWAGSSSLKRPKEHLKDHPWCRFDTTATVPIVRLDTFVRTQGLDRVDFIWADVQGAEDLVIAGAQETLGRTRYFYTEYDQRAMYEGQINLDTIRQRLPGGPEAWRVAARWPHDALMENLSLAPQQGRVAAPAGAAQPASA